MERPELIGDVRVERDGGDSDQWTRALYENNRPIEPYLGRPDYILDHDLADAPAGEDRRVGAQRALGVADVGVAPVAKQAEPADTLMKRLDSAGVSNPRIRADALVKFAQMSAPKRNRKSNV